MLKNLLILSFCLVAIKASGELKVLKYPDSLGFKGNDKLACESVGDFVSAALGYWVDDDTDWPAFFINDPFKTPKNALVVIFTGINDLNLNSKVKSYPIAGSCSVESMNALSSEMETSNGMWNSVTLDMSQTREFVETIESTFEDIQPGPIKSTNNLKPDLHSEDKDFLTQMAYAEQLFKKYSSSAQLPTLVNVHISIEPLFKAHGEKSPAVAEARKLISNLLETLYSTANSDNLILAVAEKAEPGRAKREAVDGQSAKDLNLATYYNEDYPVIFNIILWFMVVLGFSVLAICYAIGSMDPGRDSIIYRMTSTRMKKDN